ncbi:hypothetical protein ACXR2T_10065 [Leucobacter sp. HY1910]
MSNINRHSAGAKQAGQSVGGQFAATQKTEASGAGLAVPRISTTDITAPARRVSLQVGASPRWPEGWSAQDVRFGEDNSGRFYSAWSFTDEHGEDYGTIICTEFEDGAALGEDDAALPYDDVDAAELIEASIQEGHRSLYTNSYRAGRSACDSDDTLREQVLAASLGKTAAAAPGEDFSVTAPERGAQRGTEAARVLGIEASSPHLESQLQDQVTDFMHFARSTGMSREDIGEMMRRAQSIYDDELADPDF